MGLIRVSLQDNQELECVYRLKNTLNGNSNVDGLIVRMQNPCFVVQETGRYTRSLSLDKKLCTILLSSYLTLRHLLSHDYTLNIGKKKQHHLEF